MAQQLTIPSFGEIDTILYVAYVLRVSSRGDWITRTMVKSAAPWLRSSSEIALQEYLDKRTLPERYKEKAATIVEWGRGRLLKDGLSQYETDMGAALLADKIHFGHTGLVASFVPYYAVARWTSLSRKTFGVVGNRYDLGPLILVNCVNFCSQWGTKHKYVFLDPQLHSYIWETQTALPYDNAAYCGRGSIKGFKSICNGKATILTRCRFDVIEGSQLTSSDDFANVWVVGETGYPT